MPIDTHAQALITDSEAWLAEQAGKIRSAYAGYGWRKAWLAILSNRHTILDMPTAQMITQPWNTSADATRRP